MVYQKHGIECVVRVYASTFFVQLNHTPRIVRGKCDRNNFENSNKKIACTENCTRRYVQQR